MKGKKQLSLVGILLFSSATLFAGENDKGIDYYRAELYEAAKIYFTQHVPSTPRGQAENYYYLGQTYYELGQFDSAGDFYRKATTTDPEYSFGYIGVGKLEVKKGNLKEAEDLFKKANGYAKKDASVQTEIAQVYSDANLHDKATEALEKARKVNKNYSGIYIVEGDLLMKKEKIGDACSRYEMAIHFNAQDKVAYLKLSRVYETINKDRALEYLEKLIALDPDYIPAYAVIGDINRELGRYQTALNAYEKFITIPGVPLLQHERYAQLLYFTKQYDKSVEQIKYVLEQDPNNAVMHRLQAYNNYELGNFEAGHKQIESFLKNSPVEKHIYLDYITYGRLQVELKQYNEALENFRKAVTLVDSTKKTEIYKELISATGKIGDYHEQAKYYEAYFEIEPSPSALDYIYYGLAYYKLASTCISPDALAAVVTPEQGALNAETFGSYIQKGDKAFSEVIVISPNSHQGYVWRANLHALVDVYDQAKKGEMLGDAKPYYEAALEFMNGKNEDGARNNEIIECYRYLASYHAFVAKDNATAGENYKQILRINPEDAQAKQALDVLKIKY